MGYERYMNAADKRIINNITALGKPIKAIYVFPSVSKTNSCALITGTPPDYIKGDLKSAIPDGKTILHTAAENGFTAIWVAGKTAPVYLEDQIAYNDDINNNGIQDDEVAEEAIRQYKDGANLIIMHFKSTDSIMHTYGPYSEEAYNALNYADSLVGKVVQNLEPGTIVVIFADHGGHNIYQGGNHGTLLPEDMIVPIIVHTI